jgi:N utilization substance protein B
MSAAEIAPAGLTSAQKRARSVARLAAVQALYQMEVAGVGVDAVVREFSDHRFGRTIDVEVAPGAEAPRLADADEPYFAQIVRGVVERQVAIDAALRHRLAANWKLERLDATVRALLRCGAYELTVEPDTPIEVVIDEYVELAKAFVDAKEAGFVNAALDGVARDLRAT